MTGDSKLWVKRVEITEHDQFRPPAGGSAPKVFGAVTPRVRARVAGQIRGVETQIESSLARVPGGAAIARVVLKDAALAKTHRPTELFEGAGCPVVGVGGFGELLVSVTPSAARHLERSVMTQKAKKAVANISTIKEIKPYALDEAPLSKLRRAVEQRKLKSLKLRLFRHNNRAVDAAIERAFLAELEALGIENEALEYARALSIFRLRDVPPEAVTRLGQFVGTQSLGAFPEYHIVRPAAQPVGRLTPVLFPPPETTREYPLVGVIDSGVDPSNALLAPWVAARENYVPANAHDYEHGTFVAGLLVHARTLNHGDQRFPLAPCRVVDVVAFPKGGSIGEAELVAILREVLPKYPDVRVWNLSLGGATPCNDNGFSDLAIALDELQIAHNVTFVLAAGNYAVQPYRGWPATANLGGHDRICGPADSIRALTVGSIAHRESPSSRVREHEPSPFSRRGPGPGHLPKPEVVHFGGNCESGGAHAQIGVLSVDASGNLAESIGTSFASPPVTAILSHVQATAMTPLSNVMAKALVIHSAVMGAETPAAELNYRGFGVPADPSTLFQCAPWQSTLVFETSVVSGVDVQRVPFALPPCLRLPNGNFRASLTATLVYEPLLDGTFGAEYCRSNIDLSLGTYSVNKKGKYAQGRKLTPFPKHATASAAEKKLIENGFKWSPVKVYRKTLPKGVKGAHWRLTLAATDRSGVQPGRIPVALVLTIADIDQQRPVYDDMVKEMNRLGWITSDVAVRTAARIKR